MVKQTEKTRKRNRHLAKIKAKEKKKEKKEKRKKSLQYLKTFRDIKRVFKDDEIRRFILKGNFPDVNVFSKIKKENKENKEKNILLKAYSNKKNSHIFKLKKIKDEVEKERNDMILKQIRKNKDNPLLIKGETPSYYGYGEIGIRNEVDIITDMLDDKKRYAECILNKMKNLEISKNKHKKIMNKKKYIKSSPKFFKMNIQKNKNFNEEINVVRKKKLLKNETINKKERSETFRKKKELKISSWTPDYSEDSFEKERKLNKEIEQYENSSLGRQEKNFKIKGKSEKKDIIKRRKISIECEESKSKNEENSSENEESISENEESISESEESRSEIGENSSEIEESINRDKESIDESEESSRGIDAEKGKIPPPIFKIKIN